MSNVFVVIGGFMEVSLDQKGTCMLDELVKGTRKVHSRQEYQKIFCCYIDHHDDHIEGDKRRKTLAKTTVRS